MGLRILYAIQGTGNGHVSRAREIVPLLQQHGELDILISGTQADVGLKDPLAFRLHGFSFIFGRKGGVHHYETWKNMDLFRFARDVKSLPVEKYDLIVNDFEPVTAWACRLKGIESVSLSHQAAFQSELVPRPKTIDWGKLILSHYAPTTHHIGFHFAAYDDFIHTPVIRSEIRQLEVTDRGHYTAYLPAVHDRILVKRLGAIKGLKWEVFSKHTRTSYREGDIFVRPVDNEAFNQSLASCSGLYTGGGFEGPAEALFLGKKLLVSPMKYQYEQQCNAYALKQFGLPVIWSSNPDPLPMIRDWIERPQTHHFEFPDQTARIVADMVARYAR